MALESSDHNHMNEEMPADRCRCTGNDVTNTDDGPAVRGKDEAARKETKRSAKRKAQDETREMKMTKKRGENVDRVKSNKIGNKKPGIPSSLPSAGDGADAPTGSDATVVGVAPELETAKNIVVCDVSERKQQFSLPGGGTDQQQQQQQQQTSGQARTILNVPQVFQQSAADDSQPVTSPDKECNTADSSVEGVCADRRLLSGEQQETPSCGSDVTSTGIR